VNHLKRFARERIASLFLLFVLLIMQFPSCVTRIFTAAHCFYNEVYNQPRNATDYAVAAGKQYRDWDANEEYAQKSMVDSLQLATRYIGLRGNFAQDIALVKLRTPFELTTLVRPVCMDWDNVYEREQLQVGQAGKVTRS